jgi:hypothetical protein
MQYKQNLQKIDSFTDYNIDSLLLIGIVPRVAKKLRYFATLTDGYTDRMVPVGIFSRVAKQLRFLPHSPMEWRTFQRA